ncbi:MAG: hypothetical protein LBU65_09020 [Planctomycetaceae bacterium]|jgi:hypothetical protein|nr:hypothetical protein [Planctomycetaceae bacterium]
MIQQFRSYVTFAIAYVFTLFMPVILFAADGEKAEAEPDWVLPYFAVMGLLLLGSLLLMRLTNRKETSFTLEEIEADRQSKLNKGH